MRRKSRRGPLSGACWRAGGGRQGYSSTPAIQGPLRGSQRGVNPPIEPDPARNAGFPAVEGLRVEGLSGSRGKGMDGRHRGWMVG